MSNAHTPIELMIHYGYAYLKMSKKIFELILMPIISFIGHISPTIEKSLKNTLSPIYKFIITLPIFIGILTFNAYIMGDINSLENIIFELQSFGFITLNQLLIFTIVLLGPVTYITSRKRDNSIKTSMLKSIFVMFAALPLIYLNPPNLYVYILTILFSVGAYSTTYIKYEDYVPAYILLEEKELHTAGIGYTMFYLTIFIASTYVINTQYFTASTTFWLTISLGIVAYAFTYAYEGLYRDIYKGLRLNKSSRLFLYPARISVVYASGVTIINQYISITLMVLYLVPVITYMCFYSYITSGNNEKYSDRKKIQDENMYNSIGFNLQYGSERPKIKELDCDFNGLDDVGDNAHLEFSMKIEIPEDDSKGSWEKFMNTTDDINRIISKLYTPESNVDIDKFNKFYDEIAMKGYEKIVNGETNKNSSTHNIDRLKENMNSDINNWPIGLLNKIQGQLYNIESANMDNIVEFEKYIDSKNNNISDVQSYIET